MDLDYSKCMQLIKKLSYLSGPLTLEKFAGAVEVMDQLQNTWLPARLKGLLVKGWKDVEVIPGDWQEHGCYPGPIVERLSADLMVCEAVADPQGPDDYVIVPAPGSRGEQLLDLMLEIKQLLETP